MFEEVKTSPQKIKISNKSMQQKWWTPYAFAFPALLVVLLIVIIPLVFQFILSLYNINLRNMRFLRGIGVNIFAITTVMKKYFIGLGNFKEIFTDPDFLKTFVRTIFWTVGNVFFHVTIGVWLAILLNRKLPGKSIFRILLIIPWAMPQFIAALTWRYMFTYDFGAVNSFLGLFGIPKIDWLGVPSHTFLAAMITNIWLGVPFMMMTALGGLQSIPNDLYEAADIDGATSWQKFKNITIPLLKPVMVPVTVLGCVWTFNMLNVIYLISGQQPNDEINILVTKMYRDGFDFYRYGYAASMTLVIFLILSLFSFYTLDKNKASEGM